MDTLSLHGITLSSVLYLSASYIDTYTRLYRENKGKKIYTLLKVSGVNGDDLIWGGGSLVYPYWAVTLQKKKWLEILDTTRLIRLKLTMTFEGLGQSLVFRGHEYDLIQKHGQLNGTNTGGLA